jgi:hypothetical protein
VELFRGYPGQTRLQHQYDPTDYEMRDFSEVSVGVIGELLLFFVHSRGLRQGDPMSHTFFSCVQKVVPLY